MAQGHPAGKLSGPSWKPGPWNCACSCWVPHSLPYIPVPSLLFYSQKNGSGWILHGIVIIFSLNSKILGSFSSFICNSTETFSRFVSCILAHSFQKMNFYIHSQAGHLFVSEAAVSQGAESEMIIRILREMKVKNRLKKE